MRRCLACGTPSHEASSTRAERILSKINDGYAITYASGLAASYAVSVNSPRSRVCGAHVTLQALVYLKPKRVAITGGYHGFHMTIEVYKRAKDANLEIISLDDELKPGDVCWLETPLNPTGEARYTRLLYSFSREVFNSRVVRDIKYYADKVSDVIC